MRNLDLDFRRSPHASSAGWALLVAGLALTAGLAGIHQDIAGETGARQASLKAIETRLPGTGVTHAASAAEDTSLVAARLALEKAKLPWNGLFGALEGADSQDVALLALNPDVARGQVKIHAEARHLSAMLAYYQRLRQDEGLRQVALVDHEVAKQSPEAPVRFHIVAAWEGNHGRK